MCTHSATRWFYLNTALLRPRPETNTLFCDQVYQAQKTHGDSPDEVTQSGLNCAYVRVYFLQ